MGKASKIQDDSAEEDAQPPIDWLLNCAATASLGGEEATANDATEKMLECVMAADVDHILARVQAHIDAQEEGRPSVRFDAPIVLPDGAEAELAPDAGIILMPLGTVCIGTLSQAAEPHVIQHMQQVLERVIDMLMHWYTRGRSYPQTEMFAQDLTRYLTSLIEELPLYLVSMIGQFIVQHVMVASTDPAVRNKRQTGPTRSNSDSTQTLNAKVFELLPPCLERLSKATPADFARSRHGSSDTGEASAATARSSQYDMVTARQLVETLVNPAMHSLWRAEYILPLCSALQDVFSGSAGTALSTPLSLPSSNEGENTAAAVDDIMDARRKVATPGIDEVRLKAKGSQEYMLELVIDKILQHLPVISKGDVPIVVYQAFLLSKRFSPSYKKRILFHKVEGYFVHCNQELVDKQAHATGAKSRSSSFRVELDGMSVTESATLMHITMAIKQDHTLGAEFLQYMKTLKRARLNMFNVCLLLVMAKVKRYSETILHFLRKEIESILKQRYELQQLIWLQGFSPFDCVNVDGLLDSVLSRTKHNWEMLEGLLDLGTQMLELHPLTLLPGNTSAGFPSHRMPYIAGLSVPSSIRYSANGIASQIEKQQTLLPQQQYALLGAKLLAALFQELEMVRPQIFDSIIRGITMTVAASTASWASSSVASGGARSTAAANYIDLLAYLVARCPSFVLMSLVERLKDCLDQIPYLPGYLGLRLLQVVLPLMQWNHNFASSVMLFLRKGLFGRDQNLRQVSLMGYIVVLHFWQQRANAADQDGTQGKALPDTYAHTSATEVLGVLRRVLTQQSELRLRLYDALMSLADQYPELGGDILETVHRHFSSFITTTDDTYLGPLRIDRCLELHMHKEAGPQVREPMPWLISCMSHALRATTAASKSSSSASGKSAQDEMQAIAKRMAQCTLDDFDLNMAQEFSLTNNQAHRNYLVAMLVVGSYEVFFEHVFATCPRNKEHLELMAQLFEKRHTLGEEVRKRFADSKGKKAGTAPLHSDASILSLKSLAALCAYVAEADGDEPAATRKLIKDNEQFIRYLITNIHASVQKISKEVGLHDEDTYNGCIALARVMLSQFIGNKGSGMDGVEPALPRKDKTKSMFTLAVETFESIIQIIRTSFADQLESFLDKVNLRDYSPDMQFTQVARRTDENVLEEHINHLLKLLEGLLLHDVNLPKEAATVARIIGLLADTYLSTQGDTSQNLPQLRTRLYKICQRDRYSVTDAGLARAIVALLLRITRNDVDVGTLLLLARNVRYQLQDNVEEGEEEWTLEAASQLDLVSIRTATPLQSLLCNHIEEGLSQIDWCLNEYKYEFERADADRTATSSQSQAFESRVGQRLGALVEATMYMCCATPQAENVETLLRTFAHAFSTLTAFVKFKLKQRPMMKPDARFHEVVSGGSQLHERLGQFVITSDRVAESAANEAQQQAGRKAGKGGDNARHKKLEAQLRKVKMQGKLLTSVTLAAEKYDVALINLSKIFKSLGKYVKRSAVRDFRIEANKLPEENMSDAKEEEEEEGTPPDLKKHRAEEDAPAKPAKRKRKAT
ncbi:hypothetical protein RI367_005883 [Sorochytrium milnesiophthora]